MDVKSRIGGWLIRLAQAHAERLPADDRFELAHTLLSPPAQPVSGEDSPAAPDWERQRMRVWMLTEITEAASDALERDDAGVPCSELAKQCRGLRDEAEKTLSVLNSAENYGGLDIKHGKDLEWVRTAVAIRHAEEVDAELGHRHRPCSAEQPPWTLDYDDRNGQVIATCSNPDDPAFDPLRGFAPTPSAALDLVAGWHTVAPAVTIQSPLPAAPRLRRPDRESPPLQQATAGPLELLDRGGPCYEQFLTSCERIRKQLRTATDHGAWLRQRAEQLNRTAPHVPSGQHVHRVGNPGTRDHQLGVLHGMQWVRPDLIVSTYCDRWGEFDGFREHSLTDITGGLGTTTDIDAFARTLFDDPIHLIRIPAWAGPIYALGTGGCHRIHTIRLLELPWLIADVLHDQHGTEWRLTSLLEHRTGASKKHLTRKVTLIEGLCRRGIIDGEILPADTPMWTRVRCSRLPAPWLLRDPEIATTVNAAYEHCYPGALDQLGIPIDVGTQADKWAAWLDDALSH